MNIPELILVVVVSVFVSIAVSVITSLGLYIAKGKGDENFIAAADKIVDSLNGAFDTVKSLAPANPIIGIIDQILNCASIAVDAAEKNYKAEKIKKDERKAEATKFITDMLEAAGIEITEKLQSVIDEAITTAVAQLPATHDQDGKVIRD